MDEGKAGSELPTIAGIRFLSISPWVWIPDSSIAGNIGEGVEDVCDLVGWEVGGVVVAFVDGP